MAKISPGQYIREVKSEVKKVTWPSRQETTVSLIAVFVMVAIVSLFLYVSDQILAFVVRWILGLGA